MELIYLFSDQQTRKMNKMEIIVVILEVSHH